MDQAAWQEGYELALLKAYAEPFRVAHKPHVYGAFGLVKERDIAAALKINSFLRAMDGPRCIGGAIARQLSVASQHKDFAGRPIQIPAKSVLVSALAAIYADTAERLVNGIRNTAGRAEVWFEIFEEDGNAKLAMSGLHYRGTKVMAGSEIKGLYSTAPGEAINDPAEDATLLTLDPCFLSPEEHHAIIGELAAHEIWKQHYSSYNKRSSWTAFALRGYDASDPLFIQKPAEMSKKWQKENVRRMCAGVEDTVAFDLFPATRKVVDSIPAYKDRVRFMRLEPGQGELARHADITDREAGVKDAAICRLHIPICTNAKVIFQAWTKRGEHLKTNFAAGALCYLDQRKPHSVVNGGADERIHLVIDTRSTPKLRGLIADAARQA